jgi:beta-galactosidase
MHPDDTLATEMAAAEGEPLDVEGQAVGVAHRLGRGRVVHLTEVSAAALEAALDSLDLVRFTRNDPRLDVAIHAGDDGGRRVAFVANPTADPIDARVGLGDSVASAREVWDDRVVKVEGGSIVDSLEPYDIKIYECLGSGEEE